MPMREALCDGTSHGGLAFAAHNASRALMCTHDTCCCTSRAQRVRLGIVLNAHRESTRVRVCIGVCIVHTHDARVH